MSPENRDVATDYIRLMEQAILNLRMRIRYGEEVSIDEVHDLMDALHNIPCMIRNMDGWHVPENIDAALTRYDTKWLASKPSDRRHGLIDYLTDIRAGKYDHHH